MTHNTREIPLKNSQLVAVVDEDYYDWLTAMRWALSPAGYASYSTTVNKKPINYLMHRLVNDTPEGMFTDHINGNKLDNRRSNLRTVTFKQNSRSSRRSRNNTSGYKGVSWNRESQKWQAKITLDGRLLHLGYTHDLIEGARMYNEAAVKYFGEYAVINKLPESIRDSVQLTL